MITHEQLLPSIQFYNVISEKDPLSLDSYIAALPEQNLSGDTDSIQLSLDIAISNYDEITDKITDTDAVAALRDLDFLASSLLRHNIDPLQSTKKLGHSLVRLALRAQTIPRGTVYTYGLANPANDRLRTFTGSNEEKRFISAVKQSSLALEVSSNILSDVSFEKSSVIEISSALEEVARGCNVATQSIVDVHRSVSPSFFTNILRPYFEPLTINGRQFMGAGGAQMQLLSIERMIWGLDNKDDVYQDYFTENIEYLDFNQRQLIQSFSRKNNDTSILTFSRNINNLVINETLASTLKAIRKFRYPHKRVADNNFKIRSHDSVGSGSFKPTILDHLLFKTESMIEELTEHENKF
jgi:hypothetical protein